MSNSKLSQEILLSPSSSGPFKYFQIAVSASGGVAGAVYLNGKNIFDFKEEGGSISNNEAQELIKDGQNTIELRVTNVSEKADTTLSPDSFIDIALYALNSEDFVSEENRVIHITWNPTADAKHAILYTFPMKRSSSPNDLKSNNDVSQEEKSILISAITKKRELFSAKKVADIRAYYLKTTPTDTDITNIADEEILARSELELKRLTFPVSVFEDPTTQWAKVDDTIQALTRFNGVPKRLSVKLIDGEWY